MNLHNLGYNKNYYNFYKKGINSYYAQGYANATSASTITYYENLYSHVPNDLSGGKTSTIYLGGFYNAGYSRCKVKIISITKNSGILYINGTTATLSTNYEYEFDLSSNSSIYGAASYNLDFDVQISITLMK